MADRYALQFVGAKDGTQQPPKKLDPVFVGAKTRRVQADKAVIADAIGDRIFVGTLPQGAKLSEFRVATDVSLGAATLSVGTTANPTKYVNAKTATTVDAPVIIGPNAPALRAGKITVDEDLWVTVGAAALPANANVTFVWEYTIST